ncbi:hypothetical protein [Fictibacillus sp. S7]|uniref:hypothetical protein n=1 Tax=Fictibacillus sp. S7 TaxID=2212476 RepID=UPI0010281783|nr:hypothetical protein [Fictibacillus sp. S7]RXZ02146.1 hypothetical protein DMO16_22260 [Fictibacillus sp. S7]
MVNGQLIHRVIAINGLTVNCNIHHTVIDEGNSERNLLKGITKVRTNASQAFVKINEKRAGHSPYKRIAALFF